MIKRFLPKSLVGQLLLVLLGGVLFGQAMTVFIFWDTRRAAVEDVVRLQVFSRSAALVRLLEDTPADFHDRIVQAAGSPRLLFFLSDDPIVTEDQYGAETETLKAAILDAFGTARDIRVDVINKRRLDERDRTGRRMVQRNTAPVFGDDGPGGPPPPQDPGPPFNDISLDRVHLSVKLSDGKWLNADSTIAPPPPYALPTLISTVLIVMIIIILVILAARRITRPMRLLADAAERLGRGEEMVEMPEEGPVEVRRTTQAFNAMQTRVRRFVADRTRMLAAISHDLRTPLTTMRLRAEFIDDDEIRTKIIDSVDDMTRMTTATLAFARDDAATEGTMVTDIAALIRALAADFTDTGKPVPVTGADRIDLSIRPTAIRRTLRNLVENAWRYAGSASIRIEETSSDVVIAVDDRGPGIPDERLDDMFEPFVRLDESRSEETGGVGLGLSIARSIIRGHGGELTLENRAGGGLTALIRLPKRL